ncbi:uncharacterized protein LOC118739815 [Rhagoletis pomonella]|uniref:uncharacterized protein LOC118739815 n=1 Tax=Rhagoletis pomonella TaxID=28610 RepID=UPI00178083A4|nr:uncharacterized protein LOC118739815 [Rhagoletis pomonella]
MQHIKKMIKKLNKILQHIFLRLQERLSLTSVLKGSSKLGCFSIDHMKGKGSFGFSKKQDPANKVLNKTANIFPNLYILDILPRISYDAVHDRISESSVQNDILKTMRELVNAQRETNTRLAKVEENQSILSQGMDVLVGNQERIAIAFEEMDKNPQTMVLAKGIRECKVALKKIL